MKRQMPRHGRSGNIPTLRQIARATAAIRAGWTERELRSRAGLRADPEPVSLVAADFGVLEGRLKGRLCLDTGTD